MRVNTLVAGPHLIEVIAGWKLADIAPEGNPFAAHALQRPELPTRSSGPRVVSRLGRVQFHYRSRVALGRWHALIGKEEIRA